MAAADSSPAELKAQGDPYDAIYSYLNCVMSQRTIPVRPAEVGVG
jgi:hypothetical protein